MGGCLGSIKIKDHLSPAEAEIRAELGKMVSTIILQKNLIMLGQISLILFDLNLAHLLIEQDL